MSGRTKSHQLHELLAWEFEAVAHVPQQKASSWIASAVPLSVAGEDVVLL